MFRHIIQCCYCSSIRSQDLLKLLFAPGIKLSLLPFTVCIQSSIKPTIDSLQFPLHKTNGFLRNPFILLVCRDLKSFRNNQKQQGIVVCHFLKMGRQPISIGRIPAKPSTQLVIDATPHHFFQAQYSLIEGFPVACEVVIPQEVLYGIGLWKLGGIAKTTLHLICCNHDIVEYFLGLQKSKHFLLGNLELIVGFELVRLLEVLNQVVGLLLNVGPSVLVGPVNLDQQLLP